MASPTRSPDRLRRGFSLVESLVALALLGVLALGIAPLLQRSIVANARARRLSEATGHARSRIEELERIDFDAPPLTVPVGEIEVVTEEHLEADRSTGEARWVDGPPPVPAPAGMRVAWQRSARVRQFSATDLDDGRLDQPLDGGADRRTVHLKEIRVLVSATGGGVVGAPARVTLTVVRPL